jgi:hypothetical protein
LTGHTYEVRFEEVGGEITWKLIDKTANQTKLYRSEKSKWR